MNDIAVKPQAPSVSNPPRTEAVAKREAELLKNARAFESAFVAQMLSYSGLADALSSDGGYGGEAISSLLVEQYADELVDHGGFGLTEKIYEQLREKDGLNAGRTVA